MRVTRILDLIVIVLLAVVLLMPRPDVTVKAALKLPPERRERVAELQAMLVAAPDSVDPAVELANIYLDGHRPDWALATVGAALPSHPDDFRLHHLRAIAYADRFESAPAFEAASRALALCERPEQPATAACGEAARARLHLLKATLQSVAALDMRKDPALAKERIMESLHPVWMPRKKLKPAVKPAAAPPRAGSAPASPAGAAPTSPAASPSAQSAAPLAH
jgi:hypothetical protein